MAPQEQSWTFGGQSHSARSKRAAASARASRSAYWSAPADSGSVMLKPLDGLGPREQRHAGDRRIDDQFRQRGAAPLVEHRGQRLAGRHLADHVRAEEPLAQVGLRVGVHEQDPEPPRRERGRGVEARRGLAQPPLRFSTVTVFTGTSRGRLTVDTTPISIGIGRGGA